MRLSHLCIPCGEDLTTIRAVPDRHYGLPVVVCPACGEASVRRLQRIRSGWHGILRLDAALTVLVVQILIMLKLWTATVSAAIGLGYLVFEHWDDPGMEAGRWVLLAIGGLVVPLASGAWLTAGLAHWRPAAPWLAWLATAAAAITVIFAIGIVAAYIDSRYRGNVVSWRDVVNDPQTRTLVVLPWVRSLGMLLVFMPVTVCGVPLGRAGRTLAVKFRRWRWSRRRHRRRTGKAVFV